MIGLVCRLDIRTYCVLSDGENEIQSVKGLPSCGHPVQEIYTSLEYL